MDVMPAGSGRKTRPNISEGGGIAPARYRPSKRGSRFSVKAAVASR
jgi:hypothetical protein